MSIEVFQARRAPRPYRFELLPEGALTSALGLLEEPLGDDGSAELGAAVERSLAGALSFAATQIEEQRAALVLLTALVELPPAEMAARLDAHPPWRTPELCRMLFDRTVEESHHGPRRALELAELARRAADRLDDVELPVAIRHDVCAEAWAVLADTRRLAGDLGGAEEALVVAGRYLGQGSGTLLVRAEILLRKASLCCDSRRFDKGLRRVDQALVILRAGAGRPAVARGLNARGRLLLEQGESSASLPLFEEALELTSGSRDRALELTTRHNLAAACAALGRLGEARQRLAEAVVLAKLLVRPLARWRLRWLEGRLDWAAGDPAAAEAALVEARDGFHGVRLSFEAEWIDRDLQAIADARGHQRWSRWRSARPIPHGPPSLPSPPPTDRSW